MKNILVAGMRHCGSTLTFNLVKWIYDEVNQDYTSQFNIMPNTQKDINIIKIHEYNESIDNFGTHIIIPYRDIRDTSITHYKRVNFKNDIENFISYMVSNIQNFNNWNNDNKKYIKIKYEDIITNYKKLIILISKFLEIELTTCQIKTIEKKCDLLKQNLVIIDNKICESKYVDTYMTKGHNTQNGMIYKYKTFFNNINNKKILRNKIIHDYLEKYEYI